MKAGLAAFGKRCRLIGLCASGPMLPLVPLIPALLGFAHKVGDQLSDLLGVLDLHDVSGGPLPQVS